MTHTLNSYNLPCGCHVWRRRNRWIPDRVCTTHSKPKPNGLDYLRRLTRTETST